MNCFFSQNKNTEVDGYKNEKRIMMIKFSATYVNNKTFMCLLIVMTMVD